MRDRDLYATILGLTAPWKVTDVELDAKLEVVAVSVARAPSSATGMSESRILIPPRTCFWEG